MSLDILSALGGIVVHGVTDGSVDTALATLPPNPHNSTRVTVLVNGKGCYVYSSVTTAARPDGITRTTIDIRSTAASQPFHAYVFPNGPSNIRTRDHSSVTT